MTTDQQENKSELVWISIEPRIKRLITIEAARRSRSVSSLLYLILQQNTSGFTDFSAADIPLVPSTEMEVSIETEK